MNAKDIKVGEVYGVRRGRSRHESEIVPARVVNLDVPYDYPARGGWGRIERAPDGGVLVEFIEPTRSLNYGNGFALDADVSNSAGPLVTHYTFGPKNGGIGGCFVGLWASIVAERKADEQAEQESRDRFDAKADAFKPVLDAYIATLALVGLNVAVYDDGSGLHGDVDMALYHTGWRDDGSGNRPYSFSHQDVRVPQVVFDQLIKCALEHKVVLDGHAGFDEDDDD